MRLELDVTLTRGHFDLATELSVNDTSMGLLGKSGAGKSTLLGLIAGTIQPHSGRIALDGKIVFDSRKGIMVPREQRPVGAVLQLDAPGSDETVRDSLVAAYNRTLKQRRLFRLGYLVDLLELEETLERRTDQLSAGERKRVALARSLLKSPRLLLLDDTFAAIGNGYRGQLLPVLKRLQDELRLPVLYASQSLGEILELTDQLVVLEAGKVLKTGSLQELAKARGMLRYLGMRQVDNILAVSIQGHEPDSGCTMAYTYGLPIILPLRPRLKTGSDILVTIKSGDIALSRHYLQGISIQNQIKGRVCALVPSGDSVFVQVDCGSTLLAEITPRACRDMALSEGDTVYCLIKTHTIAYMSEVDAPPSQRVVQYGDSFYLIDEAGMHDEQGASTLPAVRH
ncbi:ATP-binding cassette domain-containing protein [Candidatus Methylospira mobilis]|uniref:ATP-binding cassette domain-containing protein n=1 Tax=Candidatus Methylospira mobilis TaxID=1808979 RepID=A0A5Q0BIB3_9GAMM|nr:ATP-binding cassette domain-containing protein [Candidatus Methylospira mobilis]QFY41566.1 ATP-binding cassette domain-containing protein [Candidatus Methylospira mobilis]WNV05193.1 ATP-binding cassette domain-containing protein [Candidatus Methylospira mobilis]